MAAALPAKLKVPEISRFAHRAAQLEKHKPAVSYWCEYYILQQVLAKELHKGDEECAAYAVNLMGKLEEIKEQHADNDAITDDVAAQAYIEQFGLETFERADKIMRENRVTPQTADTFLAAATFLDLMAIWQQPLDAELANKSKFAKYHALRIAKALKAGEDPNLSNPKPPTPVPEALPMSPPPLDPNDPEVQRINNLGYQQPSVESAPQSGTASPLPPQPIQPHVPMQHDVSPISPPDLSPQRDSTSAVPSSPGGGYFPRVPTFTSETAAPTLPTAPSDVADVDTGLAQPPPPQPGHQLPYHFPQDSTAPTPSTYYQQPPVIPPSAPSQPPSLSHPVPPVRGVSPYAQVPAAYHRSMPTASNEYSYQPQPMVTRYKPDEEAMLSAQKHSKWAISALNFEDVDTAVRELKAALRDLTGS